MSSAEARADEWQVLQSIYPELMPTEQPKDGDPFSLQVPVQFSEALPIHITSETGSDDPVTVTLTHLPSVLLNLVLPPTYPYEQPPVIHGLQSSHAWLPAALAEHLKVILLDMWANECILGAWMEHVQNGDQLLSSLNIFHPHPKSVSLSSDTPHMLSPLLIAHNTTVLEARFRTSTHTCPICLNRLLGTHCVALTPCSHVACRSCLRTFWGSCIAEGDVVHVGCPDPDCVKVARQASSEDATAILTAEEIDRWQWLLRKREVEKDPAITHCPVTFCQRPVRPPPPAADGQPSSYDRLRICDCGFSFCVLCRRAWHGNLNPCSAIADDIIKTYLEHPEGSAERKATELRYGSKTFLKITAQYEEDQLNRKWMDNETMACPGCQIRVEKIMGCNHMTCSKCRQHFCYLCGAKLIAANPYAHFNDRGQSCYDKLFGPEAMEGPWVAIDELEE